ncbi:MAG: tetraacyldisaccharide 4'-kinase [Ignavibacteriae bacterium]|nr:tetraacyldisaccharide 4'-kinase [Ignavibacteriota bacterium]NOG96954.1 tetraacyldisaccharide 4'-kinase [Ignavibacteriota bacterium]
MLKILRLIISPTAIVYLLIINIRNYFFDKNIFKSKNVNAKIISIGNLTVGGSGKTPAVIAVANILKSNNKKVGILSRGYGRKSKGYQLVSAGTGPETSVDEVGDEIYLTAMETLVPAAVSEKRVEGAKRFIDDVKVDTIVLDDAFQHRWINRDVDILIFDQRFLLEPAWLEKYILPLGMMREPFSSTKRADIVIINRKFSDKKEMTTKVKKYFDSKKIFYACYKTAGLYDVKSQHYYSLEEFSGQNSLVVSGIAKPFSFLNALKKNDINTKNHMLFPDHKDYTLKEVEAIRKKFYDTNSYSVITTEKDAVKLTNYKKELDDIDIYYLKIEMKIDNEKEFQKELLKIYN